MSRRSSRHISAPLLPLILSVLLSTALTLSGMLCKQAQASVDAMIGNRTKAKCAQLLTTIGNDRLKLGTMLFGALPGVELNSVLAPPTQRLTLELANELAQEFAEQAAWHNEIPGLFQSMLNYPGAVLNDLAEERGLDLGLRESVIKNFDTQNPPYDRERVTRTVQWIKQGLGYLNFTGSGSLQGASPRRKAQFISRIVIGRDGTEPWNAAGKLVDQVLPAAERDEVFKFLKEAPAAERGFFPVFDKRSGEWGMQEPETGLIWFNATRPYVTYEEAIAYCKNKNQSLPSQEQWIAAESHGIRDVFPEMRTQTEEDRPRYFRSSMPQDSNYSYAFFGYVGFAGSLLMHGNNGSYVFARCVSLHSSGAPAPGEHSGFSGK